MFAKFHKNSERVGFSPLGDWTWNDPFPFCNQATIALSCFPASRRRGSSFEITDQRSSFPPRLGRRVPASRSRKLESRNRGSEWNSEYTIMLWPNLPHAWLLPPSMKKFRYTRFAVSPLEFYCEWCHCVLPVVMRGVVRLSCAEVVFRIRFGWNSRLFMIFCAFADILFADMRLRNIFNCVSCTARHVNCPRLRCNFLFSAKIALSFFFRFRNSPSITPRNALSSRVQRSVSKKWKTSWRHSNARSIVWMRGTRSWPSSCRWRILVRLPRSCISDWRTKCRIQQSNKKAKSISLSEPISVLSAVENNLRSRFTIIKIGS